MPFDPASREAEAQAELAATRQGRGVVAALVAGFLAILATGPLLELAAAARGRSAVFASLPELPDLDALFEEVELRFDERSALVRAVRPAAQALLTRWLGYGNERALVGRDGWLHFRDDVEHLVSRRPAPSFAGDPEATIVAFRDQLETRGIALVLLPVPVKPTVQPATLARGAADPPVRRAGERALLERLESTGIEVVDLADRFARDARAAPLYLETDTHWRPEGVEIAARELALRLREVAELPSGSDLRDEDEIVRVAHRGDVAAMLDLPEGSPLYPRERAEVRRSAAPGGGTATVLLLGDSFSAIYSSPDLGWGSNAGLPDRLAHHLGLPVERIVRNAGGASATRRELARRLAADPAALDGIRAVVWQLAARELSQGEWQ